MVRVVNARSESGQLFGFHIEDGTFEAVAPQDALINAPHALPLDQLADAASMGQDVIIDAREACLIPAGIDVHVHSREPGLAAKEDWRTLARGAYRGGVTAVADMPNTQPPTMSRETVLAKARLAAASGVRFRLLLGVGAGNVAKVADLLRDPELPLCALKVFYGRTTGDLVYDDLETLARLLPASGDKVIVFHSEDQCRIDCNHDRLEARTHASEYEAFKVHSEIRDSAAAHASTRTILEWARVSYKRPIHIAHVSTPVEVELIQEAKARGVPVTCEVAPHHLLFTTEDYARLGPLVKMNPPLRSPEEVQSLRRLVGAGAVDIYATDHAPHLLEEKYAEVARSPSGVPSVELYYPLLFEVARVSGLSLEAAVTMAATRPAEVFGFEKLGRIANGYDADFTWLAETPRSVRREDVVSKCGWSPYEGRTLPRAVLATWQGGRRMWTQDEERSEA